MAETTEEYIEFTLAPTSLEEFIELETEVARKSAKIAEDNLRAIEQGDKELTDIYGGKESAQQLHSDAMQRLKDFNEASKALVQGNKDPARTLLNQTINELNYVVNSNLRAGQPKAAKVYIEEINVLKPLLRE